MDEAPYEILKYFAYAHLPPHLQDISKPMCELAYRMVEQLPASEQLHDGLKKLLEAKDCFVRAKLP